MIIGVAGPYTAQTEGKKQENLDAMNAAAAKLLELGHIPLIGVNAALPVVRHAKIKDTYNAILDISLAVIDRCEGILMIGESPGSVREKELIISKGLPVYHDITEIPKSNKNYG